ncbi:MAG: hypothetical protein H7066_11025 [Cytophagaceae bacterium]|nr:hypothetical protein [Gemmatimonadaceae bacterium]
MSSSGVSIGGFVAHAYAVEVEKLAQREACRQGEASVQLIQQASTPVGPEGQGAHLNVVA